MDGGLLKVVLFSWLLMLFVGVSICEEEENGKNWGSLVEGVLSQQRTAVHNQITGGGAMLCMSKLMPCQAYLHSSSPPPSCCGVLKEMVDHDPTCLCGIFNNPQYLKSLNVTKDEALNLPKACDAPADMSICTNPASAATTESTPSHHGTEEDETTSEDSSSESAAAFSILISFMALIISTFSLS